MGTVLVVGGGAAGLVAAWRAASLGHRVTLLEANGRLGTKLRISGGGKCNVTHAGPPRELLAAFRPAQARFLRPALHAFGSDAVVDLLHREGVATYARDNGRVFPLDRPGSAQAVVAALEGLVRRAGVQVREGCRAAGLEGAAPRLAAVVAGGLRWEAETFILATGGASYPETGTRGEGAGWLAALGVPVRPWFPALAPLPLVRTRPAWEGVALRGGTLRLQSGPDGRRLAAFGGDLVFTRTGVSGPAVLELSQAAEAARRGGGAWLAYGLGAEDEAALDAGLVALQQQQPRLHAATWLERRLPARVAADLLLEEGLPGNTLLKDLPRDGRRALARLGAALPLGAPGPASLARGEVSAGGVDLAAVDPRTLGLRGWDNLRVCGELLDLDGPVGGYNLQAAFSTGFLAGSLQTR